MSFPKYKNCKDSGIEWIGSVPSHWAVQPLKRHARLLTEKTDRRDHPVALENIESWTGRFLPTETEFEGEGVAFDLGDILFGKLRPYLAKAYVAESSGEAVGDFLVMRPTVAAVSRFLAYELRSREVISIVDGSTFGSKMPRASWDFVGAMPTPLPPADEQTAIVTFLDRETAKIDALVEEQRRLIELLKEKRQAVISQAVTKGLNPNVPMKDSGVEWLGQVPGHWAVKRLRFVVELNPSKSEVSHLAADTEVSFLPMESIGEDGSLALDRVRPLADVQTGYTFFRDGDVTIAKITPCFENGKGAAMRGLCNGIGFGTTELIVTRPKVTQTTSTYLHWLFKSRIFRKAGEAFMYGAGGQKRVPDDFVRDFTIGFPPLQQQRDIVTLLDREMAKIDALVDQANLAAVMLQERRAALISAAVTGKIDVRGLVPQPKAITA